MDANGKNVRTLSFHETHEWRPSVLNDGRIVYTRWDYVDRNATKFHGLLRNPPELVLYDAGGVGTRLYGKGVLHNVPRWLRATLTPPPGR